LVQVHLRELTGRATDKVLFEANLGSAVRALSFSRDSKRLAMFLPAASGSQEIRVLTLDGKTPPVSVAALTLDALGWSPDSRWMPYLAPTETRGTAEAMLLDVTTGKTESLGVRLNNRGADFRFSRDGETLAFWATPSAQTNPQELQVVNRRTGEHHRVSMAKPDGGSLSLGKITTTGEIAVWQASPPTREGYLVNLATGAKRLICSHGSQGGCWDVAWEGTNAVVMEEATQRLALHDLATGLDTPLTWGGGPVEERSSWRSPDGRVNVFLSNRDGGWAVYAALLDRVPNMSPVKLATIGDDPIGTQIWWTNTGLVLRTTRQQSRLYRLPMDPATGRTSSAAQPFGELSEYRDGPLASPDGKRVAVFQRSSVRSSINILDTNGKFERTVFDAYRFVRAAPRIAWRSNEELIIDDFRVVSNGPVAMVTANLRTGRVQTLPNSTIESRDWRYVPGLDELLYYVDRKGAVPVLKARSLATGADRTVKVFSTPGESVQDFQVSNDGKQIVLQTANSCMNAPCQLRVLTMDGADVRVIATAPTRGQSWSGVNTLSPDGRFLVSGPEIITTDGGARFRWFGDEPSAVLTGRGMFPGGATWSVNGTSVYVSLRGNVFEFRRWDGVTSDAIAKILSTKPK
jgi:dipeptidyl aminopeptidase/acylaminoacyl peptidase